MNLNFQVREDIKEAIEQVHNNFLKYVFEYVETGIFNNKDSGSYISAYKHVCKLEESESIEAIKQYASQTMNSFVEKRITVILGLEDEEFIKEIGDFLSKAKILQYWIYKIYYKLVVL